MACFRTNSVNLRVTTRNSTKFRRQLSYWSWAQASFFQTVKVVVSFTKFTFFGQVIRHAVSAMCLFWLLPIAGILLIVMAFYRWAMQRVVNYMYPEDKLHVINPLCLRAALDSDNTQGPVTLMLILNGTMPDIKYIRHKINTLLSFYGPLGHKAAFFKSVLTTKLSVLCWKLCDNFNIENHIVLHSCKWRGTIITTRNLREFACDIISKPIPKSSPPWQVSVAPVSNPDSRSNKYAMIFKIHPLLMDGVSLTDIFLTTNSSVNSHTKILPSKAILPKKSTFHEGDEKIPGLINHLQLLKNALHFPSVLWSYVSRSSQLNSTMRVKASQWTTKITSKSNCNPKSIGWTEGIPLALLERIKEKTGSSKSEILIACITGALRHYYQRIGETPKNVSCAFPLYEERSYSKGIYEDRVSGVLSITLPVGKTDSASRLKAVKFHVAEAKKREMNTTLSGIALNNIQRFLPSWLTKMAIETVARSYALLLGNFPLLPPRCITIWGSLVENIYYWNPIFPSAGVSMNFIMYDDKVSLGIMTRKGALFQPDVLAVCFLKEIHELALSVGVKIDRSTPSPPRSPAINSPPSSINKIYPSVSMLNSRRDSRILG